MSRAQLFRKNIANQPGSLNQTITVDNINTTGSICNSTGTANEVFICSKRNADTRDRYQVTVEGKQSFSDGVNAADCLLYRSSASTMTLDANLVIAASRSLVLADSSASISSDKSIDYAANISFLSPSTSFYMTSAGLCAWGPRASSDVYLGRSAVNTLLVSTDGSNQNGILKLGTLNTNTGITFNNSTTSYSAATLNYYEEHSFTATFSGPWASTQDRTITIRRIGKKVTMGIESIIVAGNSTSVKIVAASSTLPSRFFPPTGPGSTEADFNIPILNNGAYAVGLLKIDCNNGQIAIGTSTDGNYTAGTNSQGFPNIHVSWVVTSASESIMQAEKKETISNVKIKEHVVRDTILEDVMNLKIVKYGNENKIGVIEENWNAAVGKYSQSGNSSNWNSVNTLAIQALVNKTKELEKENALLKEKLNKVIEYINNKVK